MVPTNFFQADDEVNPLHDACKRGMYTILITVKFLKNSDSF